MTRLQALSKIREYNRARARIPTTEAQEIMDSFPNLPLSITFTDDEIADGVHADVLWEWIVENVIYMNVIT